MNKQRFSQLVRHYGGIQNDDRIKLHELVKNYPYSQIIHTLIAKANSDANTDVARQTLNYAALYTTDRSVLKNVIENQASTLVEEVKEEEEIPTVVNQSKEEIPVEKVHSSPAVEEESISETSAKEPNKVSVDSTIFDKNEMESLRHEIWEDLRQLEVNKSNYLTAVEKENVAKPKTASKKKNTTRTNVKATTTKKASKTTAKASATKPAVKKKTSTSAKSTTVKKAATKTTKKTATQTAKKTATTSKATTKKASPGVVKKKPIIKEQQDIISKFIDKEPRITKKASKSDVAEQKDLSEPSTEFGEDLISENLAQILSNQGKNDKAIDIYKKLIWKFPQKKSYFAALIEDLKK